MHFPWHNPTTYLLPQGTSEARQISKPGLTAFLDLRAEGWPNRHLLFCAKSPNSRPDTHETNIRTAPWKYYIRIESPRSELRFKDGFTLNGLLQQTNSVFQGKFCHCWHVVVLFMVFNGAISHLKRVCFLELDMQPIPMLTGLGNEHRLPPLGANTSPDRFNRSHVSLTKVHCSKNPAVVQCWLYKQIHFDKYPSWKSQVR